MATTLYLRAYTGTTIRPERLPADQTTTMAAGKSGASHPLSTSSGSGTGRTDTAYTATTPAAPGKLLYAGNATYGLSTVWTSPPVSSEVTISDTVSLNWWAYESSMSANGAVGYVCWKISTDGTESVIFSKNYGTELATSITEYATTVTPTSTTLYPGDIIGVAVYFDDATSTSMASGYECYFGYDGGTSASQYDSFVQFNETISFASAAAGTTTKLLADASDISGSGKKKLWTDAASGSATYVVNTAASPTQNQWTDTAGGTALEWFTPQLQTATVEGYFTCTFRGLRTGSSSVAPLILVYKTASDGTSAVQVGQGRLLDPYGGLTTSAATYTLYGHVRAAISNGERLLVRVYTTSATSSAQNTGSTASMVVEDTTATSIQWPATLSLYSPSVPKFRSVPSVAVSQSSRW